MDNINIYEADGTLWANVKVSADCYYRNALEGDESVELRWEAYDYAKIPVGSYVNIEGRVYRLTEPHEPTRRTESIYTFAPVFYSQSYHWKKAMACLYEYGTAVTYTDTDNTISATIPEPTSRELDWSFTGNLPDALFMLIQMIKNETGVVWNAHYAAEVADNLIEFTSQGSSIFDFITKIAELCGKEFYFDYTNATPVVNIGTLEIEAQGTHTSEGRVLLNVGEDVSNPSVQSEAEEYFTRFYFFGSTRNIVQPNSVTKSSVVNRRLPLCPTKVTTAGYDDMNYYPKGFIDIDRNPSSYTDREYIPDLPPYKVFAKSVFFDDIYPRSDLKIQTVQTRHIAVLDDAGAETGENMPIYYVKLVNKNGSAFNFNSGTYPNGDMLPTLVPSISFRSGYLQGLEYELIYHATDFTVNTTGTEGQGGRVTIQAPCFEIVFDTNSNPRLPNDNIKPQVDDECTLFNIHMPQEYIWNAQKELEQKAIDYINELNVDKSTYDLNSNPIAFDSVSALGNLQVGSLVKMVYPNGETIKSRVISIERHLDIPCDCKITLGYSARQGTIQTLRQVIEDTSANVETVVKTGDKTKAQLLGLKNGYMAQKETFDAAFDADGQFDGTRIKPLTIETKALMVGSRSQQFALSGIDFSVAKYTSGEGILSWNCTNGKLSHFTIDETCILQWNMATGSQNLATHGTTTDSQYIYAVVAKEGFPASPTGGIKVNSNTGTFLVTTEQKKFDSDNTNYYFLVGTVSSEQTESGSNYKTRIVSLTYGTTTINGKQITTGVIRSSDTNHGVIIDLDNGTITGNIKFLSGGQAVDAEQYINNTVDDEISGLGLDGTNLLPITNFWEQGTTNNESNPNYTYADMKTASTTRIRTKNNINLQSGEKYTLHCGSGYEIGYVRLNNGYGAGWVGWSSTPQTFTVSGFNSIAVIVRKANDANITPDEIGNAKVKLERGENATTWTLAPEDVKDGIDAISNLEIGGKNILRKSKSIYPLGPNTQLAPWAEGKWRNSGSGTATRTIIMEGASNYPTNAPAATNILEIVSTSASSGETSISQNLITAMVVGERYVLSFFARATSGSPKIYIQLNSGSYGGVVDSSTIATSAWKQYSVSCIYTQEQANAGGGSIYVGHFSSVGTIQICGIKLEKGTVATDWSPASEDTDYLKNALNEATSGSTEIDGGLILTKMIQAGSNDHQSGMAGLESSDVAFWAGGSLSGAAAMATPLVIMRNGLAKFGNLRLNPNGLLYMADSYDISRLLITRSSVNNYITNGDITKYPSNATQTGSEYGTISNSSATVTTTNTAALMTVIGSIESISKAHSGMRVHYKGTITISRNTSNAVAFSVYIQCGNDIGNIISEATSSQTSWTINIDTYTTFEWNSNTNGTIAVYVKATTLTSSTTFTISGLQVRWYDDISNAKTVLGSDGLACIVNTSNLFKAIETTSSSGKILTTTIKGNVDMPGVLWAGRITSTGSISSTDYNCVGKSVASQRTATGTYKLTLSGFSASPTVLATIVNAVTSSPKGCSANVQSFSSSQVVIRTFSDNTLTDFEIHVVIFGKN